MDRITKDTDIREYRRKLVVRLSKRGLKQQSIAEVLECSQGLVSQVLSTYEQTGISGIKKKKHPGASPKLTLAQQQELQAHLVRGATKAGFPTQG
ncbi:helix-turn-helix domain-containing protein [Chondrinema litorale]|uniref:helix-turn-helix domain-containing protein n=1 Tax=Chondrinema litorale TaxID=2994555 RepID=UPI00254273AC|nr:helix-turn-helix domain-containing protein [Chondrinema litorale]UZR97339.1 helix-turn-helix domain-containing protein [Chondrinema litorale]UZR99317.1 helix-turn-helix domain-containing protein [Chondrinema litorale]